MVRRSIAGLLAVDFFTQGYRISGYLSTRVRRVGDLLRDRLRSYLSLVDVYISRIGNPGDIVASYHQAQLRKDNLCFAIVPSRESISKADSTVSYFGKERHHVWLSLSSFEIEGDLVVAGLDVELEAYLTQKAPDFIPIRDGVARVSIKPEIAFHGEAFLVNKRLIDLFCVGKV